MATKIQIRRGNASAVPALDVAEPGWDVDTKTYRVGDGTSNPARIPSTKSSGSFDFSSVTDFRIPRVILGLGLPSAVSLYFNSSDPDTGIYSPGSRQVAIATGGVARVSVSDTGVIIQGNVSVSGTVDTITLEKLNPVGVNGLMVKTGDNAYAMRSLVPGNGIGAFLNSSGTANAGGATGDIIIAIANNPTIPGSGAMKVPAGTTGDRSAVAANVGHFRYNTTSKAFEGYIDGEWRSFVDYVEGKTVLVPSQIPSIQDAINYYANRSAKSFVNIQLEAGTHTVTTAQSPGSITTRINIQGATPIGVALDAANPVTNVAGSAGNWLVTYKLASAIPTGITTDHSVIVRDLISSGDTPLRKDYASGTWPHRYTYMATILDANKARVQFGSGISNVASLFSINDYIMTSPKNKQPQFRKVTAIVSASTLEVDSVFTGGDASAYHTFRRLVRVSGTVSASNSTTLTGSGTAFQNEVNVGDILYFYTAGTYAEVASIQSNTQLTTTLPVTVTGDVALQFATSDSHRGVWKISSIDTIANTVTVVNTSYNTTPPIKNRILAGQIHFCPSTVLYTSTNCFVLDSNEYLKLSNLTIRYTGTTPTTNSYAIHAIQNGIVAIGGIVGVSGAGVGLASGSSLYGNSLLISSAKNEDDHAMSVWNNSLVTLTEFYVSGNVHGLGGYGAQISTKYAYACGSKNHGFAMFFSQFSSFVLSASRNNGYGIIADRSSTVSTHLADFVNNTSHGIRSSSNSVIHVFSSSSVIMGNGGSAGHNVVVTNNSMFNLSQGVIACSGGDGCLAQNSSTITASSSVIINNRRHGIQLSQNSQAIITNDSKIAGAGAAIHATLMSLAVASNSYINGAGIYDAYASSQSGVYLLSCTGFTKTSPAINGLAGNRGSLISTLI